jgi:hypothetical protein
MNSSAALFGEPHIYGGQAMKTFFERIKHNVFLPIMACLFTMSASILAILGNQRGVVTFDGSNGATAAFEGSIDGQTRVYQLRNRVTISLLGVTNDVVKAIPIKKGVRVLTTAIRLVTKSNGSAMTLKLGDGDGTGGYQNTTLDAVGGALGLTQTMLPADTNGVTPKVYTVDDTIDILLAGVTAQSTIAAVVDILVLCEDLSADPSEFSTGVVAGSTT